MDPRPLAGRVVLITGATSGVGLEAAKILAAQGATVLAHARTPERGASARAAILEAAPDADLHLLYADLARMREVRRMAADVLEGFPRLHVLVNNAGLLMGPRVVTEDGLETTFAVNHLSHFLLTRLLLGRLVASAPARIVNVASQAHRAGRLHFDDLQLERRWSGVRAYAQSKLANLAFTYELARRLEGTGVTANAVHPGTVATGWARHASPLARAFLWLGRPFMLSPRQGADTIAWLASSPEVEGRSGGFYERRRAIRSTERSYVEADQRRLWAASEDLLRPGGALPPVPAQR